MPQHDTTFSRNGTFPAAQLPLRLPTFVMDINIHGMINICRHTWDRVIDTSLDIESGVSAGETGCVSRKSNKQTGAAEGINELGAQYKPTVTLVYWAICFPARFNLIMGNWIACLSPERFLGHYYLFLIKLVSSSCPCLSFNVNRILRREAHGSSTVVHDISLRDM